MFFSLNLCHLCTLIMLCAMIPEPSLCQNCSLEKMENVIVDVTASLKKGIKGIEPVYTLTSAACINACCIGKNISGDKKCNLMIFDARRIGMYPNCYLFYCPSREACPMKPAEGFVSYRIIRDSQILKKNPFTNKNLHFARDDSNGEKLVKTQNALQIQAILLNSTVSLQQYITSRMSESMDHVAEHLDNTELHAQFPQGQGKKVPKNSDSFLSEKMNDVLSSINATTAHAELGTPTSTTQAAPSTTTTTSTTAPTEPTTTSTTATTCSQPSTTFTSATATAFGKIDHMIKNPQTTIVSAQLGTSTTKMEPKTASVAAISISSLFSFSGVALPSKKSTDFLQNTHQTKGELTLEGYLSDDVSQSSAVSHFGEKSSLITALFFGLMFLLLAVTLIGRRMSESFWRRRYTRLDYLINGMYADV
ncbi:PREDICTED: MANSC domain-containing protein 1 [Crocodylus porosus]|uniref:MANSC domain containing 1 n=1 Tax=Crocodylus porosus TaxID=8502 RepID=A0A7M4DZC5_CROPO|nr:PREDICTED: MANSC domain-containing protein 1 [Crocodylus porosus]XP_019399807.1 PREDICTED: MANSC domain-containing protein 1 [Crocodylus porosus]